MSQGHNTIEKDQAHEAWSFILRNGEVMNKTSNGLKNMCGNNIGILRQALPGNISQRRFAEMLCLNGLDVDKTFVSCIERGARIITDIELMIIKNAIGVTYEDLFREMEK